MSMAPALRLTQAATAPVRGLTEILLLRPGPYARAFDNLILALIVLSVASIGVEAIPGLPDWATRIRLRAFIPSRPGVPTIWSPKRYS